MHTCKLYCIWIFKYVSTYCSNSERYSGSTYSTSGGSAVSKIKNKTTVYAYNSKGEYTTDSATASGAGAMEGWGGQVKATMRAMVKAKGSHQGKNGTVSNYVKTTTSWKK